MSGTDKRVNVCVIVDPGGPKERRRTFWDDALLSWFEIEPGRRSVYLEEISWVDEMRHGRWLRFARFEVVILNWGVLNGNPMFAADLSQRLARRYAPQLRQFVRRGGLLVVECQPDNWVLRQDAYDAVLAGTNLPRLRVLKSSRNVVLGKWVRRPQHRLGRAQRFFEDAADVVRVSQVNPPPFGRWFPAGSVPGRTVELLRATRDRVYTGAFGRRVPGRWEPVLLTEDGKFPVACLYHKRGEGAYLMTTMHLASSGVRTLLRPITIDWPDVRNRLDQ